MYNFFVKENILADWWYIKKYAIKKSWQLGNKVLS